MCLKSESKVFLFKLIYDMLAINFKLHIVPNIILCEYLFIYLLYMWNEKNTMD